jgi:hypothetical protein
MAGTEPASSGSHRVRDGRTWRIGAGAEVEWIRHTSVGRTITSAIPPVFAAYATVVVDPDHGARRTQDRALVALLRARSRDLPWWLGYLDTGADDVVFPDAPMVTMYSDWRYVLVEAGPAQAATWRGDRWGFGALPELMFPADRSWLVSRLWDDDWRCVGGPADLVEALHRDPEVRARPVRTSEDATPPGHTMW